MGQRAVDLNEEFAEAVKEHFKQITPLLDAELQSIFRKGACAPPVSFCLIEYDSPSFGEEFAVSLWPMNADGSPIGEGYWFLKGKAVTVPPGIYEDSKYEDIEPWGTASELLEQWFVARTAQIRDEAECPLFIGHHDSYFKTDLRTGKQTTWDQILEGCNG